MPRCPNRVAGLGSRSPVCEDTRREGAMFYTEGRTADDPTLKAALLSSSYACWRNKQNPYPVYLPPPAREALPRPMSELRPALERVRERGHSAYGYVARAIEDELRRTNDPYYHEFCRHCGVPDADRPQTEGETTNIEIAFEDMTTVVTVRSRFRGVSRPDAKHLLQLAEPANWHDAVPTFFLGSAPVKLVGGNGTLPYAPDVSAARSKRSYRLLEHVEWEWAAGISAGVYNILRITKPRSPDLSFINTVVDAVLKDEEKEQDAAQRRGAAAPKDLDRNMIKNLYAKILRTQRPAVLSVQYDYELERCIQSKFIASWDVGGLDTDDGTYRAAWIPGRSKDTGDFLLEVQERWRYSK